MMFYHSMFVFLLYSLRIMHVESAKYILACPYSLKFDIPINVTVSGFGVTSPENVHISFRTEPKNELIAQKELMFTEDGLQLTTVTIPSSFGPRMRSLNLSLVSGKEKDQMSVIMSQNLGFIFIQTDKPVYMTQQTVKYRILATDENQRVSKYPVRVCIKNDLNIMVSRMVYSAQDAFGVKEFKLPKETPPGNWSISAKFEVPQGMISKDEQIVTFEVKEYVLPRFYVKVSIKPQIVTHDREPITIRISAKYVYNMNVTGSVLLEFGEWQQSSGLKIVPFTYGGTVKRIRGTFTRTTTLKELGLRVQRHTEKRLYVRTTVTEKGTLEREVVEDSRTLLAEKKFHFHFHGSKDHFKPGFQYVLRFQVKTNDGKPANNSQVSLMTRTYTSPDSILSSNETDQIVTLDGNGDLVLNVSIPGNAMTVEFTVQVDNHRRSFTVHTYPSKSQHYLYLSLVSHLQKKIPGNISLEFTKMMEPTTSKEISVLVQARGNLLYSTTVTRTNEGKSTVELPTWLLKESSPILRIIAFYVAKNKHVVSDYLHMKLEDLCKTELKLNKHYGGFGTMSPKEKYDLRVVGVRGMTVGLSAVDKAILGLGGEGMLSREKLFNRFGKRDLGQNTNEATWTSAFRVAGLSHLSVETSKGHAISLRQASHPIQLWLRRRHRKINQKHHSRMMGPMGLGFISNKLHVKATQPPTQIVMNDEPPQTRRSYFPESWLFKNLMLSNTSRTTEEFLMPDSITTWVILAVGMSSSGGICVSEPKEVVVDKLFFVDMKLPFKSKRLEEIRVKITVYNYHIFPAKFTLTITLDDSLCFAKKSRNQKKKDTKTFKLTMLSQSRRSKVFKVVALEIGQHDIWVEAQNASLRDVIMKSLHVEPEGQRVRKSITFVLDPTAQHSSFWSQRGDGIAISNTTIFSNEINPGLKIQRTQIDLAMPGDLIWGTQICSLAASGNLMGDIIFHAVFQSKSLVEQTVFNAEDVIGDLGPTVFALLYANASGLMDNDLRQRSREFVSYEIVRLLRYKNGEAFSLTPKSAPSTWLTAAVLKTLCHATSLAHVDRENLIINGFNWLLELIPRNPGPIREHNKNQREVDSEFSLNLSADVLIASLECESYNEEVHLPLENNLSIYLEENLHQITRPTVLAKVAYALTLSDPDSRETKAAVKRLQEQGRRNNLGQLYWTDKELNHDEDSIPLWYTEAVKAPSIEATAYALLVHLKQNLTHINAIADWLVAQRNHLGAYVGAKDSIVAIQALSAYSIYKKSFNVDLLCSVSSNQNKNFLHSFRFTDKNAIKPESLDDVPTGQTLDVEATGNGLGQMQFNVQYNVPVDENAFCPFKILIDAKLAKISLVNTDVGTSNPLCSSCNFGCPVTKTAKYSRRKTSTATIRHRTANIQEWIGTSEDVILAPLTYRTIMTRASSRLAQKGSWQRRQKRRSSRLNRRKRKRRKRTNRKLKNDPKRRTSPLKHKNGRKRNKFLSSASKSSICIQVCLQYNQIGTSGPIVLKIEMLSGFTPLTNEMEAQPGVMDVQYLENDEAIIVSLKQMSRNDDRCVHLRAVDDGDIERHVPSLVSVTMKGSPAPSCIAQYEKPSGQADQQFVCTNNKKKKSGSCKCVSGICASCLPTRKHRLSFHDVKQLVSKAHIVYGIEHIKVESMEHWTWITARILSANFTGTHNVSEGDMITIKSPNYCQCIKDVFKNRIESTSLYLLSSNGHRMIDKSGRLLHRYIADENTVVLRVSVPVHEYLQAAIDIRLSKKHG